eukprot:11388126-Ditylum_brightwellii.AAC.2
MIIGINANETDNIGTGLQTFLLGNELIDAFSHLHPDIAPPHTYQHSDNRLDYIFITPALIPALKGVGFLPFNLPFLTDHGALFADFDKKILFLGDMDNPLDIGQRNLVANNPACHDKYVKLLAKLFRQHKICEKVAELNDKVQASTISVVEAIEVYKCLDGQITQFMLSAKKRCCKGETGYVWSLKLVTAVRIVCYWKTRKSDILNKRDHNYHLIQLGINIGIQYQDLTIGMICSDLTKARGLLKMVQ